MVTLSQPTVGQGRDTRGTKSGGNTTVRERVEGTPLDLLVGVSMVRHF